MVRKDDEDLRDLLGGNAKSSSNGANQQRYGGGPMKLSIVDFCSQYTSMLCYYYPIMCSAFATLVVFGLFLFFLTFIVNSKKEYGLAHDHSNIRSRFDLKVGSIDHWCLGGGNENCACEDPLRPLSRVERASWVQAVKANRKLVRGLVNKPVDVAFLGESTIEQMGGRWMGSKTIEKLKQLFDSFFSPQSGATIKGVPLGIAGDTAPNVLWRMIHGEMLDDFNPKIWWVSLGNNDLGRMLCSEEVVEMGILRVVEEILEKKPDAHIVINSVFPMTDMRGGLYPVLNDYQDSFISTGKKEPVQGDPGRRTQLRFGSNTEPTAESPIPEVDAREDAILAEKARVEEESRDRKAHMENYYKKHLQQDPVMRDTAVARNFRPGTFRVSKKPIWTSIKAINEGLRKFADTHPRVTFFDSTPVFVNTDTNTNRSILLTKYISVRGHLTTLGFKKWEERIKEEVETILHENGLRGSNDPQINDDDWSDDGSLAMSSYDDAFKHFGDGAQQNWFPGSINPNEDGNREDTLPDSRSIPPAPKTPQQWPVDNTFGLSQGSSSLPGLGNIDTSQQTFNQRPPPDPSAFSGSTVTVPGQAGTGFQFGSVVGPGEQGTEPSFNGGISASTTPGIGTSTVEQQSSSAGLPSGLQSDLGSTALPVTPVVPGLPTGQAQYPTEEQQQPNPSAMTEPSASGSWRPQLTVGGVTVNQGNATEPTDTASSFSTNTLNGEESSGAVEQNSDKSPSLTETATESGDGSVGASSEGGDAL